MADTKARVPRRAPASGSTGHRVGQGPGFGVGGTAAAGSSPRFGAGHRAAWVAALAAAGIWLVVIATLPALARVNEAPRLARWSEVAAFAYARLWGWLPRPWGVRGVVAGAAAMGFLVHSLFLRTRSIANPRDERTAVALVAASAATACLALARPVVAVGLRGPAPLFWAAIVAATWRCAEAITHDGRDRKAGRRGPVLALGGLVAVLVASPPFLWGLVALPVIRAVLGLSERRAFRHLGAGFALVLVSALALYLGAKDAAALNAAERAPGLAGALGFFRAVGEGLGVVAGLVATAGFLWLVRERRGRALAFVVACIALTFVPGESPVGARVCLALVALTLPLAAGVAGVARAFGKAALPAALVLAFVSVVWPALDGMGRLVGAHQRVSAQAASSSPR